MQRCSAAQFLSTFITSARHAQGVEWCIKESSFKSTRVHIPLSAYSNPLDITSAGNCASYLTNAGIKKRRLMSSPSNLPSNIFLMKNKKQQRNNPGHKQRDCHCVYVFACVCPEQDKRFRKMDGWMGPLILIQGSCWIGLERIPAYIGSMTTNHSEHDRLHYRRLYVNQWKKANFPHFDRRRKEED